MLYLDLDELEVLFAEKWYTSIAKFNLVSFKREDYFRPEEPCLKTAVIKRVNEELGIAKGGCDSDCESKYDADDTTIASVRALLHARYLNYTFNPVVFYYCFNANDQAIAILAEITNTPWGERHDYVLPLHPSLNNSAIEHAVKGQNKHSFTFDKAFHVSPFNPMNMEYRWVFSEPAESLHVHMDNHLLLPPEHSVESDSDDASLNSKRVGEKHFDATLVMKRLDYRENISRVLIRYPFMSVKVSSGIYWQALKLWLKKAPFYDHPLGH